MRTRLTFPGLFLVAALSAGNDVHAQQSNPSGAVEEFSPQLDVGYAMQPRVGMFGITELTIAALERNLDDVKRLVEQGADLDERDDTGGTPLMWAVQGGDIEVVNFLLDSGADVSAVGGRNVTALMVAVTSGKEAIGVRLLEAGATFSGELSHQQDYLEYASANGHAALVRALLEHGADLEESGADALCFAAKNRHPEVARALVEAGVDVNQRGNLGNDLPIIHALQSRDQAIVQLLVEHGAELNRKDKADRISIVYYAVQTGDPAFVLYLLESGAVFTEQEADQLLGSAVRKGSMEMVDLFVAGGATISRKHLFNAISHKHYDMADAIVDATGIETMDDYSLDMLVEHANSSGHQKMVGELLNVIDSRDKRGHLRLLFETVDGDHCKLNTWDPGKREATSVAVEGLACDAQLFTSKRQSTLFVVQNDSINVQSLDSRFPAYSLKVPTPQIEARLSELREQFAQNYGGNHDWVSARISTIGYLDDGQISLITHTDGPADGTYAAQFTWDGTAWALMETQGCHRFDWICHMPGVDGRSIDRWPLRRAVWHVAMQRNPGFEGRINPAFGIADGNAQSVVIFDFDGQRSELGFVVSGSDHCAEECTFTDSVTIRPDGADPIRVILANSRVSIANEFILVRPTKQKSRLYNLSTGEDVLGDVGRATWVQ